MVRSSTLVNGVVAALAALCLLLAGGVGAEEQSTAQGPPPSGKEILASKCFQCHTDAMFRDQRQDRRAWESALYRMVGRGALWTREEIKLMADYLATDFGPDAPRAGSK